MDVLSDVLRAVRLTGAIYFDVDASSPWVAESPGTAEIAAAIMPEAEHIISFHAVMSGSCWAALGDDSVPPVLVNAGDVVVFPGGVPNVLGSSPGARGEPNMAMYYRPIDEHLPFAVIHGGGGEERTRFICGYLGCDARPFNPLLAALPAILCARKPADGSSWVIDLFRLALAEGGSGRAGGERILAKLSELMFVEIIRRHLETLPHDSRGWLSGLRDPHVGEALRLIHARPREEWTLDRLAREVGLSRTAFAGRFTHYVEVSPMHYLARWRLQLAGRLLERPNVSIAQAGAEVGYESEAAFNRAFKKFVGVPPGTWRKGRSALPEAQRLSTIVVQ
ncbi:MAG: AraC family transcriptional regulator [Mesorhizobium sp.]|nr:MAG: AraC family transcriptional regulator [Mesorhizobium sp.]